MKMFRVHVIYLSDALRTDHISFDAGLFVYSCVGLLLGLGTRYTFSSRASRLCIRHCWEPLAHTTVFKRMTTKPQFPANSLYGRFFNDYLSGGDLVKLYAPHAEAVDHEGDITILPLPDSLDFLFINHYKGSVSWVACDIEDPGTLSELAAFAESQLELFIEKKHFKMYRHESGLIFSILRHKSDSRTIFTVQCCM